MEATILLVPKPAYVPPSLRPGYVRRVVVPVGPRVHYRSNLTGNNSRNITRRLFRHGSQVVSPTRAERARKQLTELSRRIVLAKPRIIASSRKGVKATRRLVKSVAPKKGRKSTGKKAKSK